MSSAGAASHPSWDDVRSRGRAGCPASRTARRVAPLRLPRHQPDRGRRHRRRPSGRPSRDAAVVLPHPADRRTRAPWSTRSNRARSRICPGRTQSTRAASSSSGLEASARPACGGSRWSTRPAARSPTSSRVDAGTVELVRAVRRGGRLVGRSGPAVLRRLGRRRRSRPTSPRPRSCIGSRIARSTHRRAALDDGVAHDRVRHPAADGRLVRATKGSSATRTRWCRRRRTPATRTTCRRRDVTRTIGADELVLLDLWGKLDQPGAVFADITWVGYTGRRRAGAVRPGVRRGRARRATRRSRSCSSGRAPAGEMRGCEVDRAALDRAARRRLRRRRSCTGPATASASRSTATASTWTTTKPTTTGGCCPAPASRSSRRVLPGLRRPVGNQHDRARRATPTVTGPLQTRNSGSRVARRNRCPPARPRCFTRC